MRITDALSGALFMMLGLFILVQASQFPAFGGQPYGAALLPSVLAGAFILAGLLLVVRDLSARRSAAGTASAPWIAIVPELRNAVSVAALLMVIANVAAHILLSPRLGFLPVSVIGLTILFVVLKLQLWKALLLAVGASLACWWLFVTLLRVPLPRGLMEGFL